MQRSRSDDWSRHRNPPPPEHLLPTREVWLDVLPPAAFPGALATHYPRIVNLIAMLWSHSIGCSAYFDELIIDRRGGRQGFPAAVKHDLLVLRDYWYSMAHYLDGNSAPTASMERPTCASASR